MASQTSGARLDTLPVEILHEISQLCGTPSALSLFSINRSIRSTCYDPLLFRKIVQSFLPKSSVENLSRQLALGNSEIRDVILHRVTTSRRSYITPEAAFWARYALATSEAAAISSESIRTLIVDPYNAENSRAIKRVLSYMPQLLICGHIPSPKTLMAVAFAKAGSQVDAIRSDSTTFARFTFCLAAEMLTAPTPAEDQVHDDKALKLPTLAQEFAEWAGRPVFLEDDGIGHAYSFQVMNFRINLFQAVYEQITTPGIQFYNNQVNCQLLIATMAQALRHRSIEIPRLTAIPLLVHPSYKNLPLPFAFPHESSFTASSSTAWKSWERSYTNCMTDSTVLEEGQWRGRYALPGAFLGCWGPAPIKFTVLREALDDASERVIDVEGFMATDGDPTRLIGSIRRETGLIRLRQELGGDSGQEWFGVLTPFGMCGVRHTQGRAKTLFWLYKEEWMA